MKEMKDTNKQSTKKENYGEIIWPHRNQGTVNIYRSEGNREFLPQAESDRDYTRLWFGLLFLVTGVLVGYIAYYETPVFVRFYLGDVIIMVLMYAFVRMIAPYRFPALCLWLLIFAVVVEGLQYIQILKILGLSDVSWLNTWFGSVGDIKDVICYLAGTAICVVIEKVTVR